MWASGNKGLRTLLVSFGHSIKFCECIISFMEVSVEYTMRLIIPWDHLLITYAKFSEKLTFLTYPLIHVRVHIRRVRNVSFSENFAYVLNE